MKDKTLEEIMDIVESLEECYDGNAVFSVDHGKVVLDQENKRLEAENEALRKSVEELRERYKVTPEMLDKAYTPDYWHFAGNLNAMFEYGYCKKCFLVPSGCVREGCGGSTFDSRKI